MESYFTLKILFAAGNNFFSHKGVLLGGSLVKNLTELYDLTKIVMLWTLLVPIINQIF